MNTTVATSRPQANEYVSNVGLFAGAVLAAVLCGAVTALQGPVAGIAFVSACGVFAWVALRPHATVLCLCALVAPLAGLRRGTPVPFLRPGEAVLLALVAIVLVRRRSDHHRWRAVESLFVLYAATTLLVGGYALRRDGLPLDASTLGVLAVPVFHLLLYLAVRESIRGDADRRTGIRALLFASIPVSMLALGQYARIGAVTRPLERFSDLGQFEANVSAGYVGRATGPFNHWHLLAGFLFPVLVLVIVIVMRRAWHLVSPVELAIITVPALGAYVLTLTYTAFVGLVVAAVIVGAIEHRLRTVLLLLGGVAAASFLLFAQPLQARVEDQYTTSERTYLPQTVRFRFEVWERQYLPAVQDEPLTGYGPSFPETVSWRYTESVYFTMLFRGGVPLLLIFCALWFAIVSRGWTAMHDPSSVGIIGLTMVAVAVPAIAMHAVFPYFTSPGFPHVAAILLGMLGSYPRRVRSADEHRLTSACLPRSVRFGQGNA